jgi:predicted CxxxxCH...CXXCH cytochrome family protein
MGIDCDRCHGDEFPYFASGTDANGDGVIDLAETDVCNRCHADGRGGPPHDTGFKTGWSDPSYSLSCDGCHGGRPHLDARTMATDAHLRKVGEAWIRQYHCTYCHATTVDETWNLTALHADGTVDVAIATRWNMAGKPPAGYAPATKVCSNVYCHSDGLASGSHVYDVVWDAPGHKGCNACHGHPVTDCTACHPGGISWSEENNWMSSMPMYPNGGPGTSTANSHNRHLMTHFSCENCHVDTVVGACGDCHDDGIPPGDMGEVGHVDAAFHVNKNRDVRFLDGGTYNRVNKSCTNTTCHTGTEPVWGDSVSGQVICLSCHGTTEPDVDDHDPFNGIRARINLTQWFDAGHGRTAASGNYSSGNPPAAFPGNPCWYCHDYDVLHEDASNPYRLKIHSQFTSHFEMECVFCHMEGTDAECLGCHDHGESLAPQLVAIAEPVDHTGWTGGATSCLTSGCHPDDATQHRSDAGTWTAAQKADIRNQYEMMGVCLKCHDEDANGRCAECHQGPQYRLGYDPGTGFIPGTTHASTSHFGYKHYRAHKEHGVWKGGKFCWDCHDAHGDANLYMIQDRVSLSTDGTFGIPLETAAVRFTRAQSGLDYVKLEAPYDGICNVCHTATEHYTATLGDGHMAGRVCTTCHEHRFGDSHASGQACNECHTAKPVTRHAGLGQPRDCTKCHDGAVKLRMDILGQFRAPSHHVQGVPVSNRHCYACHWEATPEGLIDPQYHEGFNSRDHSSVPNAPVDLVLWGPGERPAQYELGVTAVTFTANKIGSAEERGEVAKVTQVCLACHSDDNNDTDPFGDSKTPRQYAWDRSSIAARYSDPGTTPWGKYPSAPGGAPKAVTKAFSAHGNAVANEGGWSATGPWDDFRKFDRAGEDYALPNTRTGPVNVQCYDCHNSHGSKTVGVTSSYMTFDGTYNGGNLKETQAGRGGYTSTYRAQAGTGTLNPYAVGAAQCFDCHLTEARGTRPPGYPTGFATPWGYNTTFGATAPILGYRDSPRFADAARGNIERFPYKVSSPFKGGHLKASSPLGTPAAWQLNGLCTGCHDPHGVSPSLGADREYAVPLLRSTWLTSPYKEDAAPPDAYGSYANTTTNAWGKYRANQNDLYRSRLNVQAGYWLDRNTFGAGSFVAEGDALFGGLCLVCHPKETLVDGAPRNTAWKGLDRAHEAVKGWGANLEHQFTCSKCHQAHVSALPRLMRTNCLDYNHRGRKASGGQAWMADRESSAAHGYGNHMGYPNADLLGNRNTAEAANTCHFNAPGNSGTWPSRNLWNVVTPW